MESIVEVETSRGYFYEIVERSCVAKECEGVIVYGVAISRNGEKAAVVDDVSSVRSIVEELLEICCKNEVMPEHLHDIIEDYLD